MKKITTKLVFVCLLIAMICSLSAVAVAEGAPAEETNRVNIMHITDIHYIPTYYCYTGDLVDNAFATKIKGDPKLMLESYAVLETTMKMVKEANPDYLLVTGDITSNGEKQSLVDSANALRRLQEDIRAAGNKDFQVLVVPGNHDVFNNRHAADYSSGVKVEAPHASRVEFVKIFSSLGYPDLTDEEAKAFYSAEEWSAVNKHLPYQTNGDIAFVNSTTSPKIHFEYFSEDLNDSTKTDPLGGLTYVCYDDANKLSFVGFDTNLSVKDNQRTEGEYTRDNVDWYCAKDMSKYTQISMAHHNMILHHEMHEQFTPKFISYGWEEIAEKLVSKGIRYSFTGHFHCNDMSTYVSFENNNLMYEIETGATISYGSAVRETAIVDYDDGSQDFESELIPVKEADFTYLVENGLMPEGYDDCINKNNIVDVQKYIKKKLFKPWLYNIIDSFISPAKLGPMIDGIDKEIMGTQVKDVVNILIGEINTKVLKDYEYKGENEKLKGEENKIYAYANELILKGIKTDVALAKNLNDLLIYSYGAHLMGGEPTKEEDLPLWVKDSYKKFRSGKGVDQVFDRLIDGKGGLYELVENLANTPLDLSKIGLLETVFSLTGVKNVDLTKVVLNDVVPDVIDGLRKNGIMDINLHGETLMDDVDYLLDSFLTDSFKKGFGRVLIDISKSFAVDPSYDGKFNEKLVYKFNEEDAHSFNKDGKAIETPTAENGRFPSMVTTTFGKNPETDKNFVWFTSQYAPKAVLQYKEVDTGEWISVDATTQIIAYPDTLFDMGFILTTEDKNTARHNVRLTGLKANTNYYYRVGYPVEGTDGVWTTPAIFRTAKEDKTPFEVAIFSEMQQMDNLSYEEMLKKLQEINKQFKNKIPDFVISLGDIVDNGLNNNQWEHALNTMNSYWENVTQVVVPGKQDGGKVYETGKQTSNYVNITPITYNMLNLHYDLNGDDFTTQQNYFSFDYSSVHFVVLDTNDIKNNKLGTDQYKWLKEDLQNTTKPFKVVLMHKGIFTPGEHADSAEIKKLREQLAPVFYENKVNIVFSGYEHVYAETKLLNNKGEEAADGVLYVSVGSFGDKGKKYVENENIPVAFGKELHYPNLENRTMVKLSFDGEQLAYQGYIFKDFYFVKVQDYPAVRLVWMWVSLAIFAVIVIIGASVGTAIGLKNKKKQQLALANAANEENSVVEDAPVAEEPIKEEQVEESEAVDSTEETIEESQEENKEE